MAQEPVPSEEPRFEEVPYVPNYVPEERAQSSLLDEEIKEPLVNA
jgi:hypothetical protein